MPLDDRNSSLGAGVLCLGSGSEAVAAADGRNLEVQRGVLGMAAAVEEVGVGLLFGEDRDEDVRLGVVLAKVRAETALSVMN